MRIKYKFTSGLVIILISLGLALNLLIRQALILNMENSINDSLKEVMKSTREYIKYRLAVDSAEKNKEGFSEEAAYIIKYISLNYQCDSRISDMGGRVIQNYGNDGFDDTISMGVKAAENGKAVVDLKYINNGIQGILTYPVYIGNSYIGIVTINKSYTGLYFSYKSVVSFVTIVEFGVFSVIFILAFIMTSRLTKPMMILTETVEKIGEGEYDAGIKVKSKDEIGTLSNEVIKMRDKIKEQIETIKNEKEKVEKLEKSRRIFFNSVTHELKTPLTAISGYAEILLENLVDDKDFDKRAIERIYSESDRLHKLVLELIDVSKGLSFVDEEKIQIDMETLINQICDDMSIKANRYKINILREINKGRILGQVNRIRELIINILDNAIKYSKIGEDVVLRCGSNNGYYELTVENRGEPIPENIYKNIFEPFVTSSKSKEEHSRGLGLYICREIAKAHNGEISIENSEIIITKVKIPSFGNNLETKK